MALQLTGAAKRDSVANMQVRLPVVVVGGGLTAIDTATEALAYYPVQVEKFLARYEALVAERGSDAVRVGVDRGRARRRRRVSAARAGHSRRAGRRAQRAARAPHRRAAARLGRGDHRLPPPSHRQPLVHAQPRGSRKGAGGGHPVRRRPDAARDRCRCPRPRRGPARIGPAQRRRGRVARDRPRRARGADHPDRRGNAAQHRARTRGRRAFRARRPLFPAARRGRPARQAAARPRQAARCPRC